MSCMIKRYKNPDMIAAYNSAGVREKFAMENGNKAVVYVNDHKCFKFTYSARIEYQDANGALYDTIEKRWRD